MEATGLSTTKKEYRARLAEQSDDQIDAWAAETMRDVAIRRGVIRVQWCRRQQKCRESEAHCPESVNIHGSGTAFPAT